jgi:hypothetical protein
LRRAREARAGFVQRPRLVRIYADANHGFLYHYPELFGDHVRVFLSG